MSFLNRFRKNKDNNSSNKKDSSSKSKSKSKSQSNNQEEDTSSANANASIQELQLHISTLEKHKKQTDNKINLLTKEAQIALRKKDKNTAKNKLILRKQYEKRSIKLDNQIANLELSIMSIDDALINKNIINAMEIGKNAIKSMVNDDILDETEQIMSDMQEEMDKIKDLDDILKQPLHYGGDVMDDDELEQALLDLENEDAIDDPNSELYLYKNSNVSKNKDKNKSKNKNHNKNQNSRDAEAELMALELEMGINDNNNNNNNNNSNNNNNNKEQQLSTEEEKELKEMELSKNVLLTCENGLDSSASNTTEIENNNNNDEEWESLSGDEDSSDMELERESENGHYTEYKEEDKRVMLQETAKQKMNIMMVTRSNINQINVNNHNNDNIYGIINTFKQYPMIVC